MLRSSKEKNRFLIVGKDARICTITDYYESVQGVCREEEYKNLVARYSPVYAFEAGDDEIVGEARFAHRSIAFTHYEIISGAHHNFSGQSLLDFFRRLDLLI